MNLSNLNIFKRLKDFRKYGKIVYKSNNGETIIRRKYSSEYWNSVKTVLDKNGNVKRTIYRRNNSNGGVIDFETHSQTNPKIMAQDYTSYMRTKDKGIICADSKYNVECITSDKTEVYANMKDITNINRKTGEVKTFPRCVTSNGMRSATEINIIRPDGTKKVFFKADETTPLFCFLVDKFRELVNII